MICSRVSCLVGSLASVVGVPFDGLKLFAFRQEVGLERARHIFRDFGFILKFRTIN